MYLKYTMGKLSYKGTVYCKNCNSVGMLNCNFGVLISAHCKSERCQNCGCKTLTPMIMSREEHVISRLKKQR